MNRFVKFTINTTNPNGLGEAFGTARQTSFTSTHTDRNSIGYSAVVAAIAAATGKDVELPHDVSISLMGCPDANMTFTVTLQLDDIAPIEFVLAGSTRPVKEGDLDEPESTQAWEPRLIVGSITGRIEDYEAEIYRLALEQSGGSVTLAAENLGVGRATMYRKIRAYDIELLPRADRFNRSPILKAGPLRAAA